MSCNTRYPGEGQIVRKLHTGGTVGRSSRVFFRYDWAHVGCGCLVKLMKQGWRCSACGLIAPVISEKEL